MKDMNERATGKPEPRADESAKPGQEKLSGAGSASALDALRRLERKRVRLPRDDAPADFWADKGTAS